MKFVITITMAAKSTYTLVVDLLLFHGLCHITGNVELLSLGHTLGISLLQGVGHLRSASGGLCHLPVLARDSCHWLLRFGLLGGHCCLLVLVWNVVDGGGASKQVFSFFFSREIITTVDLVVT